MPMMGPLMNLRQRARKRMYRAGIRLVLMTQMQRLDLTALQRQELKALLDNDRGMLDFLIDTAMDEAIDEAIAAENLDGRAIGDGRPFFDWLQNGGLQWIYSLMAMAVEMLGGKLPPYPFPKKAEGILVSGDGGLQGQVLSKSPRGGFEPYYPKPDETKDVPLHAMRAASGLDAAKSEPKPNCGHPACENPKR